MSSVINATLGVSSNILVTIFLFIILFISGLGVILNWLERDVDDHGDMAMNPSRMYNI